MRVIGWKPEVPAGVNHPPPNDSFSSFLQETFQPQRNNQSIAETRLILVIYSFLLFSTVLAVVSNGKPIEVSIFANNVSNRPPNNH
jgi:hypothetical protein